MPIRLPPLKSLEAFVTAGRHQSFKQAAAELNLTPSAISRRIKALEDHLGARLFRRLNRAVRLTEAGATYLGAVERAFDDIRRASSALTAPGGRRTLKISLLQSFATNWLIPRLSDFHERHPEIELDLQTSTGFVDFDRGDVDLAIRFGDGGWPGLAADRLFELQAFPVCSRRMLAAPEPLEAPADLARHTLLGVVQVADHWDMWLSAADVDPGLAVRRQNFDNAQMAYRSAENGLGVALGISILVEPYLLSGRLLAPFALRLPLAKSYYVASRREDAGEPAIAAFRAWLRRAAQTAKPLLR